MFNPTETPVVILADGYFGTSIAKLATGTLRYGRWPIVAVIDSSQAGKTVGEVIPNLSGSPVSDVPVIASLSEIKTKKLQAPKALILGTAPIGGKMPGHWHAILAEAIESFGLHVVNGMHQFLNGDKTLSDLAKRKKTLIWDVRDPDGYDYSKWWFISEQKPRPPQVKVITMVGSDCSVGKMFTALELTQQARDRGINAEFVATGQTGIVISGRGVPLDRVVADYMAGMMESCMFETMEANRQQYPGADHLWLFVEGQGSLLHPAYSGVTMGLLHGSRPDAMVLCHNPSISTIKGGYQTPIPNLKTLIGIYEQAAGWTCGAGNTDAIYPHPRIAGLSFNTSMLSEEEAALSVREASKETGLPATDPVRFGLGELLDQLELQFGKPSPLTVQP